MKLYRFLCKHCGDWYLTPDKRQSRICDDCEEKNKRVFYREQEIDWHQEQKC